VKVAAIEGYFTEWLRILHPNPYEWAVETDDWPLRANDWLGT